MQTRAKISAQRRPQSRAARQKSAQRSVVDDEDAKDNDVPGSTSSLFGVVSPLTEKYSQGEAGPTPPDSTVAKTLPAASPSLAPPSKAVPRPSVLTLPATTNAGKKDSSKDSSSAKALPSSDEDDLFASDSLFGATSASDTPPTRHTTESTQPHANSVLGKEKKEKDKSTLPSIFDDNTDDLFQKVKPRSTKKLKASSFLEEEDDDEDIFGVSNSSTPTSTSSKEVSINFPKQDIFEVSCHFYYDDNKNKWHKRFYFGPNQLNFCVPRMK